MVHLGTSSNAAMVFKARAAPQGLCDNLINALKLLANQQRDDGNCPIQSIVTGLHERSRKGIMDWLRSFIEADNHSAVDVGHLQGHKAVLCPEAEVQRGLPRGGHNGRSR